MIPPIPQRELFILINVSGKDRLEIGRKAY
jgi:hypothetical protein